jgi:hypothetical protein
VIYWRTLPLLKLPTALGEMNTTSNRLPDHTQSILLQNAVKGLDALRQVQLQSDLQQTSLGIALTFVQYCTLLINSATGYDNRSATSNSAGKSRRSVNNSEIYFEAYVDLDDDVADEADLGYDVDTTPAELHAYAANRRDRTDRPHFGSDEKRRDRTKFPPGSRMPLVRWKAISDKARLIWDTMADDDKVRILALQEQRHDPSKILANTHDATHDVSSDNIDDVLIAMVTKHSNRKIPTTHPGDVRSVLSQPAKATKVQVQDHELSINGDTYCHDGISYRFLVSRTASWCSVLL